MKSICEDEEYLLAVSFQQPGLPVPLPRAGGGYSCFFGGGVCFFLRNPGVNRGEMDNSAAVLGVCVVQDFVAMV